jgi:hypothetical protein
VIHRIPSGTRDVLPDEMRELRAITDALRGVFERHGYGEVYTPTIEYESVLRRGDGGVQPAYRVVDDHGDVLALRADMTVPIARVVATRYQTAEPPLRFCYVAHAYRQVTPHRGQMREFLQAGIELVGAPGAAGTAEAGGDRQIVLAGELYRFLAADQGRTALDRVLAMVDTSQVTARNNEGVKADPPPMFFSRTRKTSRAPS